MQTLDDFEWYVLIIVVPFQLEDSDIDLLLHVTISSRDMKPKDWINEMTAQKIWNAQSNSWQILHFPVYIHLHRVTKNCYRLKSLVLTSIQVLKKQERIKRSKTSIDVKSIITMKSESSEQTTDKHNLFLPMKTTKQQGAASYLQHTGFRSSIDRKEY